MTDSFIHQNYEIRVRDCLILMAFLFVVWSCADQKEHTAPAINDRDSVSMMTSYGVNTLISDSGVIKYKIVTERWDVNIIKQPTRWTFEKGIFLEQFDEQFHVEAFIQADTAWYYDQIKLWELRGRLSIRNVNGLIFNSEELFWDGMKHELYSNQFSRVITPERTLQGSYFRSDERMTHYFVSNSKGSFQSSDMESEPQPSQPAAQQPGAPASQDTAQVQPPTRKVATKRAATPKNTQPQ